MLDFWLEVTAALARLQMAAAMVGEVLDVTEEPMRTVTTKGIWVWATDLVPVRVEALIRAGDVDAAARLVRDLSRGLRGRAAPGPRAALATCRALLAQALGGGTPVGDAYGRAAAAWTRLPRPYEALLLRERQGNCLVGAGEGDRGLAVLSSVYEGLTGLGARADADRVARQLAAYGAPPRRPWRGGRRGYGDRLSPREREVVQLVVAGRTNREIAAALSKSPHTVAKQLHAAMRKLGVGSRTALAVTAVTIGESEP
jgi:DNA-binding CsgD family transcriptional regulator